MTTTVLTKEAQPYCKLFSNGKVSINVLLPAVLLKVFLKVLPKLLLIVLLKVLLMWVVAGSEDCAIRNSMDRYLTFKRAQDLISRGKLT